MDSDEVLTADLGITKLMNVGHPGACDGTGRTFATSVVRQAAFFVVRKDCFPHESLVHEDGSVRTIVVVNRRLLAWVPANHQHLDRFIAENSMAPVVAFLKSDVRL